MMQTVRAERCYLSLCRLTGRHSNIISHTVLIADLDGKDGQVLHRLDPLLVCQLGRSIPRLQQPSLGAPRTGVVRHALQALQLPRTEVPLQLDGEREADCGLDGREKLLPKTVK